MDLALNNLQRLICHKTLQTKANFFELLISNIIQIYSNVCERMTDIKFLLLHRNSCNNLTVQTNEEK